MKYYIVYANGREINDEDIKSCLNAAKLADAFYSSYDEALESAELFSLEYDVQVMEYSEEDSI